ncbi:SapC family protein [Paraglaciecola sp.]|uniref:SapC family protein n=1 Tax=Paraglaciecola sp. TaxID=1920173 RepID=UPI0032653D7C
MVNSHIQALNPSTHKDLKLNVDPLFTYTKSIQFTPLHVNEFAPASTCYPIYFIKDRATGKLFSVALFGLEEKENLFFGDTQWRASYVSESMQCWPFTMAKTSDNHWSPHIDTSSPLLSNDQGQLLYKSGRPSETLNTTLQRLQQSYQQKLQSMAFVEWLLELKLLKPVRLGMKYLSGEKSIINGMYSIDASALQQLPPDALSLGHQHGYLAPIYTLLASHYNLYDLIRLKKTFSKRPISSLQLIESE